MAGVPSNFTVTAKDSDNNTLAGYVGTVHFSSTDTNPSTLLPADTEFVPSDNGVRVFSANLTRAGIWSITVAETTNPTVTGKQNGIQIDPEPFDHYSVSRIPNPQTVNIPFSVTIQAQDKYNNDRTAGLEPAETVSIGFGAGQTGSPASVDTAGGKATVSDLVLTQVKNAQTITFTGATPARTGVSNFFDVSSVPTLYPSQDSYIEQASPDQNFGSSLVLREGKFASVKDKTLVQFDLSVLPPTANVTNAELKLYSADIDSSGVKAYRLKQSWVEDQVTWNRADIGTLWIVPGAYSEPSGELVYDITGNFYSWNVTADVQKFVSGQYTNYGWIIYGVLSGTYNATFVSSEETPSAHSPRLVITY